MDEKEEIATKSGKVWIEDGIIRSKVLIKGEYALEHAMEDAKAFCMLGEKINGKKLLLMESGNIFKLSKETRSYIVTEEAKVLDKVAQIIGNPVTKTILSFFLGLSKMPIPTKMFSSVDEAIIWLKEDELGVINKD